jgi:hypothetical protein
MEKCRAWIKDFDPAIFPEDELPTGIMREVRTIEFPSRLHDNTVIWTQQGFKSENFELMWFANCRDKNGTEAFEGDRLCYSGDELTQHPVYGVIKFGEILTSSRESHIGFYIEWENDGENHWNEWWRHDLGYWLSQVEIIGNTHDNPELLP